MTKISQTTARPMRKPALRPAPVGGHTKRVNGIARRPAQRKERRPPDLHSPAIPCRWSGRPRLPVQRTRAGRCRGVRRVGDEATNHSWPYRFQEEDCPLLANGPRRLESPKSPWKHQRQVVCVTWVSPDSRWRSHRTTPRRARRELFGATQSPHTIVLSLCALRNTVARCDLDHSHSRQRLSLKARSTPDSQSSRKPNVCSDG